jgi:hypothetical protein
MRDSFLKKEVIVGASSLSKGDAKGGAKRGFEDNFKLSNNYNTLY